MSHFAEINSENIVQRVLAVDEELINSGEFGDANNWIQTSYNTKGGVHYAPDSDTPDDGVALRKNYAGKGHIYDEDKDAFYCPQPYPSWTLDDDTCLWNAPVVCPDDGKTYKWDEENTQWVERSL
jgi:hypothetical protein